MSNGKTIVILGGGIGGVVTATRLRKELPREHRVVLVERAPKRFLGRWANWTSLVATNLVHELTGQGTPKQFDGHGACFIETGDGKAGLGQGNFYAEPAPQMKLYQPGYLLHLGKVAYEKYWLFKWF